MAKFQPDNLNPVTIADGDTGQAIKVNPDGSIPVSGSAGGLGAVEIKDKDTDTRLAVVDLSAIFPDLGLPPGTTGIVAFSPTSDNIPLRVKILDIIPVSVNLSQVSTDLITLPVNYTESNTILSPLTDNFTVLYSDGVINVPGAMYPSAPIVGVGIQAVTAALTYEVNISIGIGGYTKHTIATGNLNPGQTTTVEVTIPHMQMEIRAKNKVAGQNSFIQLDITKKTFR